MLTVGQLIEQLATLDPDLPVGVIDIDRHARSQGATINLRALIDTDIVHDPTGGRAGALWLTARTPTVDDAALERATGDGRAVERPMRMPPSPRPSPPEPLTPSEYR